MNPTEIKVFLPENPLFALSRAMCYDSRDWGQKSKDAWLYGIVVGWDDEESTDNPEFNLDAMQEIQAKHEWTDEDVLRLRQLRVAFKTLLEAKAVIIHQA